MNFVFTGGGTAGHVTPNMALIPHLQKMGYTIHYIAREDGMERELIEGINGVIYHGISAGKLRRYNNIKNFSDPFRVIKGFFQALSIINKLKPVGVFSKGGFVSVPVVMAASTKHIPIVIHESDITAGLATKLCAPHAKRVCTTFASTAKAMGKKGVCTGTPLRAELLCGNGEQIKKAWGLDGKPVVLVMGGSLGAKAINDAIRAILPRLLHEFNVIHICGKGNIDATLDFPGYVQREYISKELPDVMAAAALVVSRAGSNSINEFLALKKPMLLIPLPAAHSRGDQLDNAIEFESHGYAVRLLQENMTNETLLCAIKNLYDKRTGFIASMDSSDSSRGTENVLKVIKEAIK